MLFGDIFLHIGNIGDLNSRKTWIAGRLEELEDVKSW